MYTKQPHQMTNEGMQVTNKQNVLRVFVINVNESHVPVPSPQVLTMLGAVLRCRLVLSPLVNLSTILPWNWPIVVSVTNHRVVVWRIHYPEIPRKEGSSVPLSLICTQYCPTGRVVNFLQETQNTVNRFQECRPSLLRSSCKSLLGSTFILIFLEEGCSF